jgi:hypothetical protein
MKRYLKLHRRDARNWMLDTFPPLADSIVKARTL